MSGNAFGLSIVISFVFLLGEELGMKLEQVLCFKFKKKEIQAIRKTIKSLPSDKILDVTKLKSFAHYKLNVTKMTISLYDRVENTGKRRKCWLPAFSLFPTLFSKALFFKVIKSWDCVAKS